WLELVYKKAKAKSKLKSSVAVVHVPSILKPNAQPSTELEELLAKGLVTRFDREHAASCKSLVIHSDALQARNELLPDLRPETVTVVFGVQQSEAQLAGALQLAQDYFEKAPLLMADSAEAQQVLREFGLGEVAIWKAL
ncbi:MAG: hypothetical protein RLZZ345_1026, partial [Actinomycetota bacterium]